MQGRLHTREDSGLRIDAEGRFFHDDVEIEHPSVLRAFRQGLERTAEGQHLVRFGWDWAHVQVEDAPLLVRSLTPTADSLDLELEDGRTFSLPPSALSHSEAGFLYVRLREDGLEARLSRAAAAQLADALEEGDGGGFVLRLTSGLSPIARRTGPGGTATTVARHG